MIADQDLAGLRDHVRRLERGVEECRRDRLYLFGVDEPCQKCLAHLWEARALLDSEARA